MAKNQSSSAIVQPNLGLYYDRPSIAMDRRMLEEGLNFRIKEGKLNNLNLGWDQFEDIELNGQVLVISNFAIRGGAEQLIFATPTDLYVYNGSTTLFITPIYATGTVTVAGSAVTMSGGTNLGDMTGDGGLAAAIDTTTSQATAACATKASATFAYVGKTLATPSKIAGAVVYGSNDNGYVSGANPATTAILYAKNGTAPANSTDGTVIGTISFTDTADESTGRTITSTDIATTWDHVWIRLDHLAAAATMSVAEIQFFSPGTAVTGSGTNWDPEAKAGDYIAFGAADENDPEADWYLIDTVTNDTAIVLDASTPAPKYPAGTTYTIRQTFTGEPSDVWTYDVFLGTAGSDDYWIGSNGVDDVVTWNGTDDFAEYQPESTLGITKVKSICVYSNMVIYGGFEMAGDLYPNSIANSDVGDPLNLSAGLAEIFKVHARPEGISAMYTLADNLIIYSPRSMVVAQFVGDPIVFQFRTAASGTGPLSPNAIADYGDRHVFLGFDSQYDFDGVTLAETANHVFREVIRRNDPLRRHFALAHFDEENGDLLWLIPQTSDAGVSNEDAGPDQAYVQHYLEDVGQNYDYPVSRRQCPFVSSGYFFRNSGLTWDQISETWEQLNFRWNDQFFASAFPLNLFGSDDGKIYTLNTSQNQDDGSALTSYVRFPRSAAGDGKMRGLVKRIYPFADQFTNSLFVSLFLADHAAGPYTTTDTQEFDQNLPEGGHFTSHFRRGRFFAVEFGTAGPSEPYQLSGYEPEVVPGGYR